jgi:hypothetical protein
MALDPVKNFAIVTLASGYNDVATSVNLVGGDGAKLPAPSTDGNFNAVYWNATDYANPSDDPNKEIVRVTARSTDTLTITRAQEGTAATNKNTGGKTYKMILAFTKKMRDDIASMINPASSVASGSIDFFEDTDNGTNKITIIAPSAIASDKTITLPDETGEIITDASSELKQGWNAAGETPTYASIDSPTGVITVASGAKTKYPIGSKIKFDQSQALTSYWSFDANSNDGVGSNNGTDTSMSYTAGKFSNAATFNGTTSKIVISDAASLKPTGEFTIGGWFKTSNTGALKALFASFAGLTNYAGILLEITSGNKLGFTSSNNTGSAAGTNFTSLIGTTTVTDNAWHYVVVTFRNNFAQVYLDGNLEVFGYCLAPAYQATNYVRIGCEAYTGTDSQFMNGQIDDLYLINGYALDQDTIKAKYDAGTSQGTGSITVTKRGIVTATTYTTVTAYYGTDYTLANSAITNFYYSLMRSPLGFPLSENKWGIEISDATIQTQVTPTINVWYNKGGNIVIPIGLWRTMYSVCIGSDNTVLSRVDTQATLSTANNSSSDPDFESAVAGYSPASNAFVSATVGRQKILNLLAKTTYYLNIRANSSVANSYILGNNAYSKAIIRATCAYL